MEIVGWASDGRQSKVVDQSAYSVGVVHPDRFKLNTPAAETEQLRRQSWTVPTRKLHIDISFNQMVS